jgi:hypothetical protein
MTSRTTSLRVPATSVVDGKVGTARVREDKTVGRSFAERELMRRTGGMPNSTFDDVVDVDAGAKAISRSVAASAKIVTGLGEPEPLGAVLKRLTKPKAPVGPKERMQALGRMRKGAMNKTETAYAAYLDAQRSLGNVLWYRFEGLKLRLADSTFYDTDFVVLAASGQLEIHEVKGFMTDDANVKIKVAASQYPFRFLLIRKAKGGGWNITEV